VPLPGEAPVLDADLAAFVSSGVAVVVATRDAALRPAITRAWGPEVAADGRSVTLCLNAAPGSRALSNLEDNGAMAATFSLPSSYRTVQMKGQAINLGVPSARQLERVEEHVAAFAEEAEQVGLPRDFAGRLIAPDFVAVSLRPAELYDQTPGANAGARL
jgi:Pyridoxamine 5'-phosphate oxidase